MDSRHQFFAVKRLGQVVIGTKAKPLELVLGIIGT